MILIATFACLLPISFIVWAGTLISSWLRSDSEYETVSPVRCALSAIIPMVIALWGLRKKSLDKSGAVAGIVVGFILTISNYAFLASLLAFFISSSKATKFRSKQKRKLEDDFKEGGQRNWIQVISNGGVGAQMAILYMLEKGLTECTIDFLNDYAASWFSIAVLASLAGANGDTWASEIASVLTKGDPVLITSMKRVPKGTNGGISVLGLVVSLLGGAFVGLMYYVALILCLNEDALKYSPPQWPLILIGSLAGLFDSVLDSLLGATLQFSGIDKRSGKIVEQPGPGVKRISGVAFLDNHSVNLLSTLVSAILVPYIGICIWNQLE